MLKKLGLTLTAIVSLFIVINFFNSYRSNDAKKTYRQNDHARDKPVLRPKQVPTALLNHDRNQEQKLEQANRQEQNLAQKTSPLTDDQKLFLIKEILRSKSDNDPRLDHDLKVLSKPLKAQIKNLYYQTPAEALNERGTLVFLLGRNLSQMADFQFFQQVLSQPVCKSFVNCQKIQENGDPHEQYHSELTLVYPQVVALKSLEKFLQEHPHHQEALKTVQNALDSDHSLIRSLARRILAHQLNHEYSENLMTK